MANTNVNLVGLDFDSIKTNLKNYLKSSGSPFKDVDFEGSNISQLVDILAYNTYLNNYYLNMVSSEMFLDSAQLRDSIISHAKELNYIPRSYRSASATVNFTVTPSDGATALIVPKNTTFTTKIGSSTYTFATDENTSYVANTDGMFYVTSNIYEGTYAVDTYVFDSSNTSQRFVISNPNIDTNSITVNVIENSGANVYTYNKSSSFLGLTSTTTAFFLQAAENNQYEIIFGDDIICKKPKNASTIVIEYRICNGSLANGARVFDIDGPIQGYTNVSSITTSVQARGGAEPESDNSIRLNAVRSYQNQERAVTASDFESIILTNFPEVRAVSAYGGEDLDPPVYGKVFVSVDTYTGEGASDIQKEEYRKFLKERTAISIDPVITNPDFLFLDAFCTVNYDIGITTLKTSDIQSIVKGVISNYNLDSLGGFKKTLRYSQLVSIIDKSHNSIISNSLTLTPWKYIVPELGAPYNTVVDFGFQLTRDLYISQDDLIKTNIPAVYSTAFTYNGLVCALQDDNNGNLGIYTVQGYETNTLLVNIGSVDYQSGRVIINNFNISTYEGPYLKIYAYPLNKDVQSVRNSLIEIRDRDITVTAIPTRP